MMSFRRNIQLHNGKRFSVPATPVYFPTLVNSNGHQLVHPLQFLHLFLLYCIATYILEMRRPIHQIPLPC